MYLLQFSSKERHLPCIYNKSSQQYLPYHYYKHDDPDNGRIDPKYFLLYLHFQDKMKNIRKTNRFKNEN